MDVKKGELAKPEGQQADVKKVETLKTEEDEVEQKEEPREETVEATPVKPEVEPVKEAPKHKTTLDLGMGHGEDSSGTSDSDHEPEEQVFVIREKKKFFNHRKHLEKFVRKQLEKVDNFTKIECSGNSYDLSSCEYIAEIIAEKASDNLYSADFSNMFVTKKETLPPSMEALIGAISLKPITELYLHDNAFGPIGVATFKDFLLGASQLKVLSVSNCGLGPVASTTIAESLIANGEVKLTKLRISRSRVENPGAVALANYFKTYISLEHLEIF